MWAASVRGDFGGQVEVPEGTGLSSCPRNKPSTRCVQPALPCPALPCPALPCPAHPARQTAAGWDGSPWMPISQLRTWMITLLSQRSTPTCGSGKRSSSGRVAEAGQPRAAQDWCCRRRRCRCKTLQLSPLPRVLPGRRLLGFDVETLYELHYQMITLGKVFCNKQTPHW